MSNYMDPEMVKVAQLSMVGGAPKSLDEPTQTDADDADESLV